MNSITYNVPVHMVSDYRGRQVIVRSHDAASLIEHLGEEGTENVQYVRLLSPDVEPDTLAPLANWGRDIPLDVVISNPATQFPKLYNFSKLLDKHPIRASIAVKPGFVKAVKLALALNFAVKLEVDQPETQLIREMMEVLDLYLHRPNVSQPIDYFHGMFLSFYHEETVSLWCVQEDDPDYYRFVTDDGIEKVSPRFSGIDPSVIADNQAENGEGGMSRGEVECDTCQFVDRCGGYFKWPDRSYSCDGVKNIFDALNTSAAQLRSDVSAFAASQGGAQS